MDTYSYIVTTVGPTTEVNTSGYNKELAEELNDEMTQAVLPVTIFVGIEVFAAFFGNIFVIYVFLFRYHVCNFRYFVLCLAFTDLTSSLTTMPGEMVTQLYWYVYPLPELCKVKSFFNVFTVSAEALCLLTIGVDRYLKVCRPLGQQMKPKHAIIVCGIIYILAFILAVPVYIFWGTHHKEMNYKNTTILVHICEKDERWLHTNHPLQYSVAIEVIISICLVIMFILYVFVVKTLLQNKRFRSNAYELGRQSSPPNSSSAIEIHSTPEVSENDTSSRDRTSENIGTEIIANDAKSKNKKSKVSAISVDDDHDSVAKHRSKVISLIKPGDNNKGSDSNHTNSDRANNKHTMLSRVRRKTLIMFILTVVFIITTILYLTLLSFIAKSILDTMSDTSKAVYFFFFRLYFINHVINPIIYGVLDPHFRQVISNIKSSVSTTFNK